VRRKTQHNWSEPIRQHAMDGNNNNRAARFPVLRAFPSRMLFQKTDNRTGALPTRHHKIPRLLQLAAHISIWAWPAITSLSLSVSLCTFTAIFYRSIAEAAIDTKQKHMSLNDGFRNTSTKLTGEQKRIPTTSLHTTKQNNQEAQKRRRSLLNNVLSTHAAAA